MNAGALICLGLIGLQLGAQIGSIVHESFRKPRAPHCPSVSNQARRDYLDRKAEIERDARNRL